MLGQFLGVGDGADSEGKHPVRPQGPAMVRNHEDPLLGAQEYPPQSGVLTSSSPELPSPILTSSPKHCLGAYRFCYTGRESFHFAHNTIARPIFILWLSVNEERAEGDLQEEDRGQNL